jgi:uncharacterized protein YdhG (YjbR/CyaY superfamily)
MPVKAVDEYLAKVEDPAARAALQHLRELIREECPGTDEVISYGVPGFRLGKAFIHYAAFKNHCSLFAGYSTAQFADELTGYKTSKGTIQFNSASPLPDDLARRIIRQRWLEHLESRAIEAKKAGTG